MEYVIDNKKFMLSYQELKNEHHRFCNMADEEFKANIPAALHLACVISWFKELPNECTVSDCGIIHELVHILHIDNPVNNFKAVRTQFEKLLNLD
jgi:hypothetical protein